MQKLKVAIIGGGMISNSAHLPAYKYFSDRFSVEAVCDVYEKAAKDTAAAHGIPNVFTDAREMLEKIKPDLVSVCAPNMLHKENTLLALNAGANVICEKPLAFNAKDAKEMFDTAEKNGKFLCACQSMRFTPDRLSAKKYISDGLLGEPYYCEFSRIRRRGIPTWGSFHIKEKSGGGALIDIGVHMLDAAVWLLGRTDVVSVSASTYKKLANELGDLKSSGAFTGNVANARHFEPSEMNVEDFASGSILFGNGARINFKTAWAANLPDETTIRIIGEKSGIELPTGNIYTANETKTLSTNEEPYKCGEPFSGHFHVIENVYDVIANGAEPIIKPEETKCAASIIEAFYKSAELSHEVAVDKIL